MIVKKRLQARYKRSGVILYSITPSGEPIYGFGLDTQSGDISDWGGTVEYNETIFAAAARELCEESYKCIKINPSDIASCDWIHSTKHNAVSFLVYISYKQLMELVISIQEAMGDKKAEMSGVKLLFYEQIIECITNHKFYNVVEREFEESEEKFKNFDKSIRLNACNALYKDRVPIDNNKKVNIESKKVSPRE